MNTNKAGKYLIYLGYGKTLTEEWLQLTAPTRNWRFSG